MGVDPPEVPFVNPGDDVSAEWANKMRRGSVAGADGLGAADREGFETSDEPDFGDAPELYEITSKMQLSKSTCDASEGEWIQYICKGRKVRPIFTGAQEEQYATHPASPSANAMPEVTLFYPEQHQEVQPGGASKAVFHPTYAIGARVMVVQTTEHRWIVGRPMYQARCKLTSDLYPCGSATAVLVDENCDAVTECFGGHAFRVYDTINILEFDPRAKAEDGTLAYIQFMPDAQDGVGQWEVCKLGGTCCDESESSSVASESSVSGSSESSGGQCCDFVTVTFSNIVETNCFAQVLVDSVPTDVINNIDFCSPKGEDTYDDWPAASSCVWESEEFTLYCDTGNRCAYIRTTWAGHTDFGSSGLTVELLECNTDHVIATWYTPGVNPPGVSGPITGIPSTGGDGTFQVEGSTADVVCSDSDCTDSSSESLPEECITCFDSLCVEDLENYVGNGKFAVIVEDGCLKLQPIGPCEESS
jgi:hypothetical protein